MTTHPIPAAALKKHIAILGMNGSGKTSVAKSQIIEPALERGERVCNIDPTGVGWGLRLSASGKSKGFAIYIVGGEHADFPLFRRDGKAWGEIVGTSSDSYVFDTSQMTVEDRGQWFTDFAETLIRKNKGPINLVLDEAHLFAPQAGARSGGIAPKMLHATNNLLALGRSKGLIVTMISQRPAKLHKDSLTQAHTLIAMALMAPQDRNAVKEWVADQADVERGKEIIASLPSLKPGEGWIWAPKEGVLERVKFARPRTFDSSSAPDGTGDEVVLSPINPDAIKARLAGVAKETVANDPKALRAEVAKLRGELQKASKNITGNITTDPDALQAAEDRGYAKGYGRGKIDGYGEGITGAAGEFAGVLKLLDDIQGPLKDLRTSAQRVEQWAKRVAKSPPKAVAAAAVPRAVPTVAPRTPSYAKPSTPIAVDGFDKPQTKVLQSLAMWQALGHDEPSREMVAAVAGYKPSTGNYNNIIGGLVTAGAVGKPAPGRLSLQVEGLPVIGTDEARAILLATLDNPQKKVIATLVDQGVRSRGDIAAAAGYQPSTGNFNNIVGSLNTIGITRVSGPGCIELSEWAQELLTGHGERLAA